MSALPSAEGASPYKLSIPGHGTLTGYTFNSSITGKPSVHRFAQVPYALPVSGSDRFTIAKPLPEDFDYTGDYGKVGLKCPQPSVDNPIFQYGKSPSQENVQYSNIFIPSSDKEKPAKGWPVLIYIHGGWLQYNEPNRAMLSTADFNSEFAEKFILVTPGYRLNIFGFLSAKELLEENENSSNFGFWDQRLAIEWTYKNVEHFGGDPNKITVGGISAGAYSTFFQLSYELYHPEAQQIIKQAIFHSNLVYVQPKTIEETQEQFDEIVEKLNISKTSSAKEKLAKLRELEPTFIEDFIKTLNMHTFRAVTDDRFVSSRIITDLYSGEYSKLLQKKDIRILVGEVDNEPWKYSMLNTPTSKEDLVVQVENYYPERVIKPLLKKYPDLEKLDESDPAFKEKLRVIFGDITSDGQVHASERGFIDKIVSSGFPSNKIYRYRVAFRARWLDSVLSPEHRVIHAFDHSLWFFYVKDYTKEEIEIAKKWNKPYLQFLSFEKTIEGWETGDDKKFNLLRADGEIEYVDDPFWKRGCDVAEAVYQAQL